MKHAIATLEAAAEVAENNAKINFETMHDAPSTEEELRMLSQSSLDRLVAKDCRAAIEHLKAILP